MAETVEDDSKVDDIIKSAERLVHKDQMGEVYKVCCITTGGLPTGFEGEEQFLFPVCCMISAASLGGSYGAMERKEDTPEIEPLLQHTTKKRLETQFYRFI